MAKVVNVGAAKTQLSRLIDRAARGEEIVIARAGRPVARLGPLPSAPGPRRPGLLRGRLHVADDFDAPMSPAELTRFTGGSVTRRTRR